MDVTKYLELKIAPLAIFDALEERGDRVRFQIPQGDPKNPSGYTPVTYRQFAAEIRDVASFLGDLLAAEDRVAIFAPNRVEWASASLAIQAAGGVLVPVYPANTAEQARYVLDHGDVKVLFVDTAPLLEKVLQIVDSLPGLGRIVLLGDELDWKVVRAAAEQKGLQVANERSLEGKVLSWSSVRELGRAADAKNPDSFEHTMRGVKLSQKGMMLYTSGTTGNPKGVPLTHQMVGANGRDWLSVLHPLLKENAIDVLWLPMSHIFGFGEMCLGNTLGFTTYLSDPVHCIAQMPRLRPDVFMSVPSHWEKLAERALVEKDPSAQKIALDGASGGNLSFALSGGAGLKKEVKEFFHRHGILIIEGYGLTECSPTLTMNQPENFRFDTVGKPFPSVELKLAEDGEILAKGPNVFSGYHKDEAATREVFDADGWFKTGDVGRWTEDGFLQIIDRKKDILVTAGGKNVPPANVEMRFRDDPRFLHVVVYGEGKKFLVAGLWMNDALLAHELNDLSAQERAAKVLELAQKKVAEVNEGLANYEKIKSFVVMGQPLSVESETLTSSFKVRRKKIYETFRSDFERLYERPVAPLDGAEAKS